MKKPLQINLPRLTDFSVHVTIILTLAFSSILSTVVSAQLTGKQAEMTRLEQQADELIANGDPHGAALSIGKAAMMAGILAKQVSKDQLRLAYKGTEAVFRTQEYGYRAIAIFEQAGGHSPAPRSSCKLLRLADHKSATAHKILTNMDDAIQSEATRLTQRYLPKSREWIEITKELQADFSCS